MYISLGTNAGEEAIKYQIKQLCNQNTQSTLDTNMTL